MSEGSAMTQAKGKKGQSAAGWFYGQPGFHAPAPEPPNECTDCEGRGGRSVYCCSDEQCSAWETCETCRGTGEASK